MFTEWDNQTNFGCQTKGHTPENPLVSQTSTHFKLKRMKKVKKTPKLFPIPFSINLFIKLRVVGYTLLSLRLQAKFSPLDVMMKVPLEGKGLNVSPSKYNYKTQSIWFLQETIILYLLTAKMAPFILQETIIIWEAKKWKNNLLEFPKGCMLSKLTSQIKTKKSKK